MEKLFIKNRGGKTISVILEKSTNQVGLVFIMHGMGACKEEAHMEMFAKSFRDKNYTVVRFDNRHTLGESEGNYKNVNFTNSYEDLEDVINWAKKEAWYMEPFALVGHSLGGGCVLWYGANHPKKVQCIAPISTVIGGHQTLARFRKEDFGKYKDVDTWARKISFQLSAIKAWKWWQFKRDILQYDIVPEAHKFSMPFLMIVGDQDLGTPLVDQMKLYKGVPEKKEIHVIKGARHTLHDSSHLAKAEKIFKNWIDKVLKGF